MGANRVVASNVSFQISLNGIQRGVRLPFAPNTSHFLLKL
jgi:hypothetical protein